MSVWMRSVWERRRFSLNVRDSGGMEAVQRWMEGKIERRTRGWKCQEVFNR